MKILGIQQSVSFGNALSTKQIERYNKLQAEARRELGIKDTTATIFDFSVPSAKNDTGIGTSFSPQAQQMAGLLKAMCGINSIQLQPQGEVSNYVRSPYSGTSFSLGMHLIDLNKLGTKEYGSLLTEKDLKSPYMVRVKNQEQVDYDNVFAQDGQKAMLRRAYSSFEKLPETSPLKQEFSKFKKDNRYWLERDTLFEAAVVANGSPDVKTWSKRDQNVYANESGDQARIAELRQVRDEAGNNVVDFEQFVQFIADKQQKESKANFNAQGIAIYGDCQIGFSQKDLWAHKAAFHPTYEFGCDIAENTYSCWSPAIDFSKLDGEAGELLYNKFDLFFKRYDGARIDAAWQLINPMLCEPMKNGDNDVFDENGNKLGIKLENQPEVGNNGQKIIKDIILKAAKKHGVPNERILLEMLGGQSYDALDAVKDLGTTLIHITRWGRDDMKEAEQDGKKVWVRDEWGRVKYYESTGDNKYQNMRPGDYTIGNGTHDDILTDQQVDNIGARANYLANDLCMNKGELEYSRESLLKARFAELFTTSKQFITLPDIFGSKKGINIPNTTNGNWSYRATQDYEREYFKKLSQGKGLNMPDALAKALKAKYKGASTPLVRELEKYAYILRQQGGPMTIEEADRMSVNA